MPAVRGYRPGSRVIPAAWDWIGRLTAYGWIDLGCDLALVAAAVTVLRWLHHIRADTRALLKSESYGHHARRTQ